MLLHTKELMILGESAKPKHFENNKSAIYLKNHLIK